MIGGSSGCGLCPYILPLAHARGVMRYSSMAAPRRQKFTTFCGTGEIHW